MKIISCRLQGLRLLTVGFFQGLPLGHGLLKLGGGLRAFSRSLLVLRRGLRLQRVQSSGKFVLSCRESLLPPR